MTLTATGPRDIRDAKRLAELEVVIERGQSAFVEVGDALLEVRDSKLYRVGYPTFEAYCKGRWGFAKSHAYRLMEASEVVGALSPIGDVPTTESQARELAPVVRDHGPAVAAAVMAEASANGAPTAESIRAAAAPFRPRLDPAPDPYYAGRATEATEPDATPDHGSPEYGDLRRALEAVLVFEASVESATGIRFEASPSQRERLRLLAKRVAGMAEILQRPVNATLN